MTERQAIFAILVLVLHLLPVDPVTGDANAGWWPFGNSEAADKPAETGRIFGTLHNQSLERSYLVYIPESYTSKKPAPLLIVLHGGHGNAVKTEDKTGFNAIADRHGFIVVYPEAAGKYWNDGRKTTKSNVDDVTFINALIDHLAENKNIDQRRIYVTGLSNGGMMTQRLACELPHRVAAFASVVANIPVSLKQSCKPDRPVAMMLINGSADPLMPPAGGEIKKSRWMGVGGTVISSKSTAEFWAEMNHCDGPVSVEKLPDSDPGDGTRIERTDYTGCSNGGEVMFYNVIAGGHTWPGSSSKPFLQRISGTTSHDMNASETIWKYFEQHSRK